MHRNAARRTLLPALFLAQVLAQSVHAMEPLMCPGGAPLGRFEMIVVPQAGGVARDIQTVNRLLPGDKISYRPAEVDTLEKKKVRIALLLVPSDGSRIVVFDPKPADEPASWTAPFRAQLVSVVWGPEGLDKAKVASLVDKNNELIGQLADYAAKTEETQALIQAITQQQTLDTGQDVGSAVAGFASQFPSTKLDRTQSADAQLTVLLHGVNPSLSAYDPLATSPQQQAAQTAGLAAAVGGLFFGNGVGLAASGGALLVNLSNVLFPHVEFLSALAQPPVAAHPAAPAKDDTAPMTGLCASKAPHTPHTQRAYLWALRIPDTAAPELALTATEHLPIGVKSSFPIEVKGRDWKLAARVQDWRLVWQGAAASGAAAPVPVAARVNVTAKTIELDLATAGKGKLKAGPWKLAANWDWDPIAVSGNLVLHDFPRFESARLSPDSQDKLNSGAGTLDLELTGDDFEFVRKIEYKKQGDPFAQPAGVPFHLPKEPPTGPETSLKIRMDAKTLLTGNYVFLIAQADGKIHEMPFKVVPAAPTVSGTPIVLNTGVETQTVILHGTGLDRVGQVTADHAQISLGDPGSGDTRSIEVKVDSSVDEGTLLTLHMKVKDFENPVAVEDAFLVAGPRPEILTVRQSSQNNARVALNPGEMAANSTVSFELSVLHAPAVSAVNLSCEEPEPGAASLKVKMGEAKENAKLARESPDALFLSFRPEGVGQPGCSVVATLATPHSGQSVKRKLGAIVLLPGIDSFQLTNDRGANNSYIGVLSGQDLESIAKVGWDARNGMPVDAIPVPVSGPGNKENLRIAVPWPSPAPHAPLYVWLRGEDQGRLTSAQY